MKVNLKIKIAMMLAILSAVMSPVFCYAVEFDTGLKEAGQASGLTANKISAMGSIPSVLGDLVGVVLSLLGIFFFILVLYAGFTWMTAAGSGEQVDKAKKILMSGAIGLVIVLSAYTITSYVFQQFLAGSPSGVTGNDACKIASNGQDCGDNSVCLERKCVTECEYTYGKTAKCGAVDSCNGVVVTGYCPGQTDKCCVPDTALEEANQTPEGGQQESNSNMTFELCSTKGGYCVKTGDAKCGTYPGYKEIQGSYSDCSGDTPSCCASGCRAKKGMCLTKNECAGAYGKEESQSCGIGQICCVTCVSQGGNCFAEGTCSGKVVSGSTNGCGEGLNCCLGGSVQ